MKAKDDAGRVVLDNEKIQAWLAKGAQPTDRVLRFLDAAGVRERAARNNPKKAEPGEKAKERAEEKKLRRQQIGKQMAGAIADHARDTPAATGQITIDMIESAPGYAMRAELIRDFVRQDPARAALVVRDLIRAEQGGEDARNG